MLILGSTGLSYEPTRSRIKELIPDRSGRLLIIPLAAKDCAKLGRQEMQDAVLTGFDKNNITVFDKARLNEIPASHFDYILVPGGFTFMLLYYVKLYRLDKLITDCVKNGAVYMGFSAGACLACRDIEYIKAFEDNNHIQNGDFSSLGLTDKYVLCHYDSRSYEDIKACRQKIGMGPELLTINEAEIVVL